MHFGDGLQIFLKAPLAPIYTEGAARAEKTKFFDQNFPKMPNKAFLAFFKKKEVLESSENQFGRPDKKFRNFKIYPLEKVLDQPLIRAFIHGGHIYNPWGTLAAPHYWTVVFKLGEITTEFKLENRKHSQLTVGKE